MFLSDDESWREVSLELAPGEIQFIVEALKLSNNASDFGEIAVDNFALMECGTCIVFFQVFLPHRNMHVCTCLGNIFYQSCTC